MTTNPAPTTAVSDTDKQWRLLWWLWFLRLFRPEWTLAYFVPALGFFRKTPTILLLTLVVYWFIYDKNKRVSELKWFAVYCVFVALRAPFSDIWSRAIPVIRFTFELWLLGAVTIAFANSLDKLKSLLKLYLFFYLYMAVWGLVWAGRVEWDNVLNEEDAFGPLMCIGVAYCSYYLAAVQRDKTLSAAAFGASVLGVIASFARGAFVSMLMVLAFRTVFSKRVVTNLLLAVAATVVVIASVAILFPSKPGETGNPFWKEMSTIFDGTSKGTGLDRKVLWAVATEEFKANPLFGVGAMNFGIEAPKYVERVPFRGELYADPASIWGRALHNGYFQVLSEGGIVGVGIYALVVLSFFRLNLATRRMCKQSTTSSFDAQEWRGLAFMLFVSVVTYYMNLMYYDITYYNWFFDYALLNVVMYVRISEALSAPAAVAEPAPAAAIASGARRLVRPRLTRPATDPAPFARRLIP